MMTSAGRLSSTTNQGSPSRSARRERPMANPIAAPSAMAMAKERPTRRSVTPRLTKRSPELASLAMARATACGSGSWRGPAKWAPTYQAAMSSANETSRAATFSIPQTVERAAVEFACRSYEFGASDLGQHAIECARVRFFVGYIAAEDTFRIALAEDRESLRIAVADARGKPLP